MNKQSTQLLIYCLTISGIAANPLIAPNLTDVVLDFGKSVSTAGLLLSAIPLAGVFLAPFIGLIADYHGRKVVITTCLLLFGIAGLASSIAPSYNLLLAARLIQGIGSAGLLNLALVLIADHWSGQERTALMGRNAAALAIGLVVMPPLSGYLAELTSWRWSLALGSITIPVAFLAIHTLEPDKHKRQRSPRHHFRDMRSVFNFPVISSTLISGFVLFVVIFGVFLTILPIHLDQTYGLDSGARGAVLAAPAAGSIIAALCLGRLSKLLSRKAIIVASGLLISLSILVMSGTNVLWILILAAVIYGLGDGVSIPSFQDLAATSAPVSKTASVLALWTSSVRLGQLMGPLLAGALLAWTSTGMIMLMGAIVFCAVSVFWIQFPINRLDFESD